MCCIESLPQSQIKWNPQGRCIVCYVKCTEGGRGCSDSVVQTKYCCSDYEQVNYTLALYIILRFKISYIRDNCLEK